MTLRTGKFAFKVVSNDRESIVPLFIEEHKSVIRHSNSEQEKEWEKIIELLKRRKVLKKYKKGSIVRAAKGFPPLLAFSTREAALNWRRFYLITLCDTIIIPVIGYQQETPYACKFTLSEWRKLSQGESMEKPILLPAKETIAFRKIKVIG